ncbi:HesA/MoeB/ThiF family protein [Aestuariibius sp. 2305UL40-4]|uniref:HesA/MoeB/ThiF family protein n=1 Tax=Aestuariibius violaceus TaxID=3234132 RepID=UPI00345E571A
MIVVFLMAAVIWGIGAAMGTPKQARWTMLGLLIVAVLAIQIALPEGHPLRQATGSSPALWLLLLAFGGLVYLYRQLLGNLRARANQTETLPDPRAPAPIPQGPLTEIELNRYARHIALREIGGPGQVAIKRASVLVIGAGGLGSPALQYLASAGIGTIGVIDGDIVESSNLQRQTIHRDAAIGKAKVFSAADTLTAQNPFITVKPYNRAFTEEIADDLVAEYDLILEGTDDFATREVANAAAVVAGKPLISAALTQWEGQISVYDPANGAPCYTCLFPDRPDPTLVPTCAEAGVLGPLPGVLGAMMAVEAVKLLTDAGQTLRGEMLIYDALWGETRRIKVKRRPDCPVCGPVG